MKVTVLPIMTVIVVYFHHYVANITKEIRLTKVPLQFILQTAGVALMPVQHTPQLQKPTNVIFASWCMGILFPAPYKLGIFQNQFLKKTQNCSLQKSPKNDYWVMQRPRSSNHKNIECKMLI